MDTITALIDLIQKNGAVAVLVIALFVVTVGTHRGWWYSSRAYSNLEKERDAWRTLALSVGSTANQAVDLAKTQLGVPQR